LAEGINRRVNEKVKREWISGRKEVYYSRGIRGSEKTVSKGWPDIIDFAGGPQRNMIRERRTDTRDRKRAGGRFSACRYGKKGFGSQFLSSHWGCPNKIHITSPGKSGGGVLRAKKISITGE